MRYISQFPYTFRRFLSGCESLLSSGLIFTLTVIYKKLSSELSIGDIINYRQCFTLPCGKLPSQIFKACVWLHWVLRDLERERERLCNSS